MSEPNIDQPHDGAAAPAPRPAPPVLAYEKPLVYRYKSNLPPPGMGTRVFWKCCFFAGRLLSLVYRPRPARRLFARDP